MTRHDNRIVGYPLAAVSTSSAARRLAPGAVLPPVARRASKTEYGDEDVELWTPGAVGDRVKSDKRLRKVVREAGAIAEARAATEEPQPND